MTGNDLAQIRALGLWQDDWLAALGPRTVAEILNDPAYREWPTAPTFDPVAYIQRYPDVADFPQHPLLHYLRHGQHEGRQVFPVFDPHVAAGLARPVWVETHDLSLTGAPIALQTMLAGVPDLARQAVVGSATDGPLRDDFAALGAATILHGQSARRLGSPDDLAAMVGRYDTLLRASGAKAVIANSFLCFPVVMAARGLGLPCVWLIHEPDAQEMRAMIAPSVWTAATSALTMADALVFASGGSCGNWGFAPGGRVAVVEKALPPDLPGDAQAGRRIAGCGPQDVLVLSVGTVSPRKGQADLVAALTRLADAGRVARTVLVMVGFDRSDHARDLHGRLLALRQRGLRLALLPQSRTAQDRRSVDDLFAAADIFVMSSRAESLPLTTAEALRAGCPVIATTAPGVAEMVTDHETGLLYDAGDDTALARALACLIDGDALRDDMRARIRQRQDPAAFARMIAQYRGALAPALNRVPL
jgi:D-inositol-3-phosphate glycosyltransferase